MIIRILHGKILFKYSKIHLQYQYVIIFLSNGNLYKASSEPIVSQNADIERVIFNNEDREIVLKKAVVNFQIFSCAVII